MQEEKRSLVSSKTFCSLNDLIKHIALNLHDRNTNVSHKMTSCQLPPFPLTKWFASSATLPTTFHFKGDP